MIGYARNGRGWERVETTLVEGYHSDGGLRKALRDAGFERTHRKPWSPWPDQHLEPAIERNLWTARVPELRAASVRARCACWCSPTASSTHVTRSRVGASVRWFRGAPNTTRCAGFARWVTR